MKKKHQSIFYTPGLISLLFLPILFYLTTIENREAAINCGSIEVRVPSADAAAPPNDSLYNLQGYDDKTILNNFELFLQNHKNGLQSEKPDWKKIYKINLPESSNYNLVIRYIDMLQRNKFLCGISDNTIKFVYYPELFPELKYVRLTNKQEIEYIINEVINIVNSIYIEYIGAPNIRVMEYYDFPLWLGDFVFYTDYVIKEEPRSAVYFKEIGLWFLPILICWCVLFYVGIQRK